MQRPSGRLRGVLSLFVIAAVCGCQAVSLEELQMSRLLLQQHQQGQPGPQQHHQHAPRHALTMLMTMLNIFAELSISDPAKQKDWWSRMGHIGTIPKEVETYWSLAASPGINTMCEIGLNAGHSAVVMMVGNRNVSSRFYSFDFLELEWSLNTVALMRRLGPGRFHVIKGSSFEQLPAARGHIECDLFSVDGEHTYEGCMTDFVNAVKLMRPGGILLADDIADASPGCKKAWEEFVAAGYISKAQCEAENWVKGWCWGSVAKTTGPLDTLPQGFSDAKYHPPAVKLNLDSV